MDVVCVGGGPAGLYFAICAAKLAGDHRIRVIERDPPGATFGWGVTYSDRMLDLMFAHDAESAREVRARSVTWQEQEWRLSGRSAYVPHSRSSLERAAFLDVLGRRAVALGVDVQYGREVDDLAEFTDADLVVAADGVGSAVRRRFAEHFGVSTDVGRSRFIWLGTDHVLPRMTFAFEQTPAGWIWMHAYPSSTTSSTCVVECSPDTWQGLRLDSLASDEGLRLLEDVFRETLAGGRLFGQSRAEPSRWQRFQHLTTRTLCHGNVVLLGDAGHAAHFTLASGTKRALKDAVALAHTLRTRPDLPEALHRYDERRRESANRAVADGRSQAEQWEDVEQLLDRDVLDLVHAMAGLPDDDLRRRRPLHRAEQLGVVRLARRQVGAARRWLHARQAWPGVDGRTAAPVPDPARSSSTGSGS
jgi:2-polyprenyl-6-methoxyphenol hydroxylase-like FAD-dependent oxidoreductase